MMIINKVSEVMGRQRVNIADVVEATGLARNTVSGLYHGTVKRVDLDTLEALCKFFKCDIGDLFEYREEAGD